MTTKLVLAPWAEHGYDVTIAWHDDGSVHATLVVASHYGHPALELSLSQVKELVALMEALPPNEPSSAKPPALDLPAHPGDPGSMI